MRPSPPRLHRDFLFLRCLVLAGSDGFPLVRPQATHLVLAIAKELGKEGCGRITIVGPTAPPPHLEPPATGSGTAAAVVGGHTPTPASPSGTGATAAAVVGGQPPAAPAENPSPTTSNYDKYRALRAAAEARRDGQQRRRGVHKRKRGTHGDKGKGKGQGNNKRQRTPVTTRRSARSARGAHDASDDDVGADAAGASA